MARVYLCRSLRIVEAEMKTRARVLDYVERNPAATYREIMAALGLKSTSSVFNVLRRPSRQCLDAENIVLRTTLEQVAERLIQTPADTVGLAQSVQDVLAQTDGRRFSRKERMKRAADSQNQDHKEG